MPEKRVSRGSSEPRPQAVGISEPSGEQQGGERGTAIISGATFTNKSVVYSNVAGMAMIEGDIALGLVHEVEAATEAARKAVTAEPGTVAFSVGITGSQFRWPNGQVPYEIDPNLPNQQRVTEAIAHWEANTPIRFPLRTAANSAQFTNFVTFSDAGGCWSAVGMQGGPQTISLGPNCSAGNAIHEIGHAVGLWHEQSREDRGLFVTIRFENIQDGMSHNFNQHITDGDDLGLYDYGSIMHYPRNAFSKNGQDTIVPTAPNAQIGQRDGLSAGDIAGVRAMYPSVGTVGPKVSRDPITTVRRFKKINDDGIVLKPVLDPRKPLADPGPVKAMLDPRPGLRTVINPNPLITGGLRPFSIATAHHAPLDAEGDGPDVVAALQQQLLDAEAAAATAKATAAQANADAARLEQLSEELTAAYADAISDMGG